MREISGKVEKTSTDNGFSNDISSLIHKRTSSGRSNKERNIIAESVVYVSFIHFSTYFYHLVRFIKIYHFSIYKILKKWLNKNLFLLKKEFEFKPIKEQFTIARLHTGLTRLTYSFALRQKV